MAMIGEIATVVTAKVGQFVSGMTMATRKAKTFEDVIRGNVYRGMRKLRGMLFNVKTAVLSFGAAIGAVGLVRKATRLAAEAESMQVSYATFLKSMDKAQKTLRELDKFSKATPFQPVEVKEAGKQLLAFGFEAEKLMDYIRVIGDLAAGSQKPMNDFVDILGKVRASGVASMADVNRMADRGVPIYQNLAKAMDVAKEEVRDLVSTGKVGFPEMWKAVRMATEEGGLFAEAAEKLSKTTEGKLSTLRGNIDEIFKDVGTAILDGLDIKDLTEQFTDLAKTYKNDIVFATEDAIKGFATAIKYIASTFSKLQEGWTKLKIAGKYWDKYTEFTWDPQKNTERMARLDREIAALRRGATVRATRWASMDIASRTDRTAEDIQRMWAQQERREGLSANIEARRRMMETGREGAGRRTRREAEKAAKQRADQIKEQRKLREAFLEQDRAQQMRQLVIGHF